jgi:hypothetical protein
MNLYWVTTDDHDEDWFIFSRTKRLAEDYHEGTEGYDRGAAKAERILTVPKVQLELDERSPRHAQLEDLAVLGFEVLHTGDSRLRSVRYGSRVFVEGPLQSAIDASQDDRSEAAGRGRLHGTPPRKPAA